MIVLHIGMPKTGTTFLQKQVFRKNADILYGGRHGSNRSLSLVSDNLRDVFQGSPSNWIRRREDLARLLRPLVQRDSGVPVLLSDERFFYRTKKVISGGHRMCPEFIGQHLEGMADLVHSGLEEDFRVLVGVRRPDKWFASCFAEQGDKWTPCQGQKEFEEAVDRLVGEKWGVPVLEHGYLLESLRRRLGKEVVFTYLYEDIADRPSRVEEVLENATEASWLGRVVTESAEAVHKRSGSRNRWRVGESSGDGDAEYITLTDAISERVRQVATSSSCLMQSYIDRDLSEYGYFPERSDYDKAGRFRIETRQDDNGRLEMNAAVSVNEDITGEDIMLFVNGLCLQKKSGNISKVRFKIKNIEGMFREGSELRIVSQMGVPLVCSDGEDRWHFPTSLTHTLEGRSSAEEKLAKGYRLTKKGTLAPRDVSAEQKRRYGKLYHEVRSWFKETLGYDVLVTHGTLLGLIREGDLIAGDDDFDCMYLSGNWGPKEVVEEREEILQKMEKAGFRVRVGVTGHIKVHGMGVKVDLMPAWLDKDMLNISSFTSMPLDERTVYPLRTMNFYGVNVLFMRGAERFLVHQYGEWTVPDGSYRHTRTDREKSNRRMLEPSAREREAYLG